ncbi:hypothetical protein EDD16DRAFT_307449 [Pisolithus croceorrhizus]|nr:hypothetical protein EDD16DRAFT_307449 [Pisolithus croceorrhizus]
MATKQSKRRSLLIGGRLSSATSNSPSTPAEEVASNSEKLESTSHGAFARMKRFFDRSSAADTQIDQIQRLSETDLKPLRDFNATVTSYPMDHPYTLIVLGAFTSTSQSLVNRANVDKGLSSLFNTIRTVYEFLTEENTRKKIDRKNVPPEKNDTLYNRSYAYNYWNATYDNRNDPEDLKHITLHESTKASLDTLAKIAQVTSESTRFIKDYSTTKRYWKRTGKDINSETESIAKYYAEALSYLMQNFRDPKAGDSKVGDSKAGESKAGDSKAGDSKVGESKAGDSKAGDSKAGDSKAGDSKDGDSKAGETEIKSHLEFGDINLEGLACADGAGLNDILTCLDGTRTEVLTEIINWIHDTNESVPRILWLNGQDGAGKSTIAHTVVRWFTDTGGLGACFCFARDRLAERREERIFTTIARDLARGDPAFGRALADAVSKDRSLKTTYDVSLQWQRLILEPFSRISRELVGNVVVLIDDLDESGPDTSRSHVLSLLASTEAIHLPPNLRILVTSRPLPDIKHVLDGVSHVKIVSLDGILEESARDITFYMKRDVVRCRDIGIMEIEKVVERSAGAFECARLHCEYMKRNRPGQTARERWEELMDLEPKGRRTLMDGALELVLEGIIPNDRLTVSRFRNTPTRQTSMTWGLSLNLCALYCSASKTGLPLSDFAMGRSMIVPPILNGA